VTELSRCGSVHDRPVIDVGEFWSFADCYVWHVTFDLTSATGKLMATMLAGISEFERSLLQERIRSGLDNARAAGKTLGRQLAPVQPTNIKNGY